MKNTKVPVLLIAYRRPTETRKVLQKIQQYYPDDLYVFVDSSDHNDQGVELVKELVLKEKYASNLHINFQNVNLGCGLGPVEAINWTLSFEKYVIILEDDCVPVAGFFEYMEWALRNKEEDLRCLMVSGNKYSVFNNTKLTTKTRFAFTHGWATWRRAWKSYDYDMVNWEPAIHRKLIPIYAWRNHWVRLLSNVSEDDSKSYWDYQWQFHIWKNNGYSLQPPVNLVQNIGFNSEATHTYNKSDWRSEMLKMDIPEDFREHSPRFSFFTELQNSLIEVGIVSFLNRIYLKIISRK
jgi:hypothetical protein